MKKTTHRAQGNERAKWQDPIVISTIVIAAATVVNLAVSCGMWLTTRDYTDITKRIFNAANRPYVGVFSYTAKKDDAKRVLTTNVEYRDFGTVPANSIEIKWELYVDGKPATKVGVPDHPSVLFPQVPAYLVGIISEDKYSSVVSGASVLELEIKITYKGVAEEEYYTYEKSRYVPELNGFIAISGNAR